MEGWKFYPKNDLKRVFILKKERVKALDCKNHPIMSVTIVREFPEVISIDLPRVPLERKIDIGIDLLLYNNPI